LISLNRSRKNTWQKRSNTVNSYFAYAILLAMSKISPSSGPFVAMLTTLYLILSNVSVIIWLCIAGPPLLNAAIFEPLTLLQLLAILVVIFFSIVTWILYARGEPLNLLVKITHGLLLVFLVAGAVSLLSGLLADEQNRLCYAFMDFTRTPNSCVASFLQIFQVFYYWSGSVISVIVIGLCGASLATMLEADNPKKSRAHKRR
jgi:hypothetical protein